MGFRYYEGAAAGTVMVGQAPNCLPFQEMFDWPNAVVHMSPDGSDVEDVLAGLMAEPERVRHIGSRNAQEALLRHDWIHRWRRILEIAGLPAHPRTESREATLKLLADRASLATDWIGGTMSDDGNLRAGDWVEVRSKEEILGTLDKRGELGALPFMPEMFQYCGRRFQVFKRAHKTCDPPNGLAARRMASGVHLASVRCDGMAHGGCQAGCLIFWKEAWLKRVAGKDQSPPAVR